MSQLNLVELIKKCNGLEENTFRMLGPYSFAYFRNLMDKEILLFSELHTPIANERPNNILSWNFMENLISNVKDSCLDFFIEDNFKPNSHEIDFDRSLPIIDKEKYLYDVELENGFLAYNLDLETAIKELLINSYNIKIILLDNTEKILTLENVATNLMEGIKIYINGNYHSIIKAKNCCSSIFHIEYGREYMNNLLKKEHIKSKFRYHRWDLWQVDNIIYYYNLNGKYTSLFELCYMLNKSDKITDDLFIRLILDEPLEGYDINKTKFLLKFFKSNLENKINQSNFKKKIYTTIDIPLAITLSIRSFDTKKIELFSKASLSKDQYIYLSKMLLGIIEIDESFILNFYRSIFIPFLKVQDQNFIQSVSTNYMSLALLKKIIKKTKKQIDKLSSLVSNVDELVNKFIQSFSWEINEKSFTNFPTNLRLIQTDIYAFGRMFGNLDITKERHYCDAYGQMNKIVYYAGGRHTENIIKLIKLFFDTDPDETIRDKLFDIQGTSDNLPTQGFVDMPKLDYFEIDYNLLVPKN